MRTGPTPRAAEVLHGERGHLPGANDDDVAVGESPERLVGE